MHESRVAISSQYHFGADEIGQINRAVFIEKRDTTSTQNRLINQDVGFSLRSHGFKRFENINDALRSLHTKRTKVSLSFDVYNGHQSLCKKTGS